MYDRQRKQRFEEKETAVKITYHDTSICISFEDITRKTAQSIGEDMVNQMICQNSAVEWNGNNDLWLEQVDYAILNGFGTEDGLLELLKDIAREHGCRIVGAEDEQGHIETKI